MKDVFIMNRAVTRGQCRINVHIQYFSLWEPWTAAPWPISRQESASKFQRCWVILICINFNETFMLKRNKKLTLSLKLCPIMKLNICFTSIWSSKFYKYFRYFSLHNSAQLSEAQVILWMKPCNCLFKVTFCVKEEMNYLLFIVYVVTGL